MDEAPGNKTTTLNLTRRILNLNFGAIHTSSMVRLFIFSDSLTVSDKNVLQTFTNALYYLAEYPEHAQTLREVQGIIDREGWTYVAITKMIKVDSFIKESQRPNSLGCCMFF